MSEYSTYIRSEEWRTVRTRYRRSALPQRCYVCGDAQVELHHKTYKRLGRERLTDLLPLCRVHHGDAHALLRTALARGGNQSKWNLWTAAKRLKRVAA